MAQKMRSPFSYVDMTEGRLVILAGKHGSFAAD